MTQQHFLEPIPAVLTGPPSIVSDPGFVEVPSRCYRVQAQPVTLDQAVAAADARGRFETVIAVPFTAYLSGTARPAVLERYLARCVVDPQGVHGMTGPVTHRVLAVADLVPDPLADSMVGDQVAYVAVSLDVTALVTSLGAAPAA